jgi:sugar/nucleoside kinase (ribokinase family)
VAVVGRVGEDLYGRFLLERLAAGGVETAGVVRDREAATGMTIVAVDHTGERSFVHHFGANARFGPEDLDWTLLAATRHLHLGGFFVLPALDGEPAAGVLAEARRRGLITSLDVCWDRDERWISLLRPCLPHVDYCMPSQEETERLTGRSEPREMAEVLREAGCGAAVIKLGERGVYYSGAEGEWRMPAYRVPVRDTTGAGDCFIAGFLHARLRGWDVPRALRFGNACGGLAVGAVGALSGLLPDAEVEAWAARQALRD